MIQKNKLRIDEIEKKISDILDAISLVEENLPDNAEEFIALGLVKDGLYKKAEFAIESVLDICNILNSDLRLGVPDTEDDLLNNLETKKIFPKKIVQIIREMKRFRNVLVHKYGNIHDLTAYKDVHEGLKDFEPVIAQIEQFLEKHKKQERKEKKNY